MHQSPQKPGVLGWNVPERGRIESLPWVGLRFGYAGYGTFLRIRSNDERIAYGVGLGSGQRG